MGGKGNPEINIVFKYSSTEDLKALFHKARVEIFNYQLEHKVPPHQREAVVQQLVDEGYILKG